jgi:hyperosmotically inducible periplasmic protein
MTTTKFVRCALLAALCVPLAGYAADRRLKEEARQYSDSAVTARIKAELAKDQEIHATGIQARSTKGRVRLTGLVPTQEEAERAELIAKSVKGVVTVQNDIQVGGTITPNVGATR